jgi:hypothetical protein
MIDLGAIVGLHEHPPELHRYRGRCDRRRLRNPARSSDSELASSRGSSAGRRSTRSISDREHQLFRTKSIKARR